MLVAKSPAVGVWAPMTLHSVAIGFVREGGSAFAGMASVPISVWRNTTRASLSVSMPRESVWTIGQENYRFALLM